VRSHLKQYGLLAETFIKRDGSKAPTAIHDLFALKYQPLAKVTTTADFLENQFTLHDVCDENHKQKVEARVKALLETTDDTLFGKSKAL
jgi:hypothetical protein